MRAKMSNPDSGVRALRPDLYKADERWLVLTSLDEARAILAETEPGTEDWGVVPYPTTHGAFWCPADGSKALNRCFVDERLALAESLSAFLEG